MEALAGGGDFIRCHSGGLLRQHRSHQSSGTDSGAYAFEIRNNATPWNERYYDLNYQEFEELKKSNTNNSFFLVSYTYQQLGSGMEYFKRMVITMNREWSAIRREVMLEWAQTATNCPFSQEDLDIIKSKLREPIRTIFFGRWKQYQFQVYEDIDTNYSRQRTELEYAIFETDVEDIKTEYGIFVYGPSGCGKSYPLIALCNEFVRDNKKCSYVETRNFLESLKNNLNNKEEYFSLMAKVKEVDVLVLDNLGDEKISEWTRDDIISGILDYRIKNDLLTYITSSYTLEELVSLYEVSKTNSEVGRIKANKFIEKIKTACPRQILI